MKGRRRGVELRFKVVGNGLERARGQMSVGVGQLSGVFLQKDIKCGLKFNVVQVRIELALPIVVVDLSTVLSTAWRIARSNRLVLLLVLPLLLIVGRFDTP